MTFIQKGVLFLVFALIGTTLHAQIEAASISFNGQTVVGFGAFIHAAAPIGKGDEISGEVGLYYFSPNSNHLVYAPFLAGYRHTLNNSGTGFYIEPFGGYSFGGTDIQATDAQGNPVYNADGTEKDLKLSGPTAGLGLGYILHSIEAPINFGLRYERIFISGGPSANTVAFRVSWSILTKRRLQGN